MNNSKETFTYFSEILKLHEKLNFTKLSDFVSTKVIERKDSWFSEARYGEVCEAIKNNIGTNISAEHIDNVIRNNSIISMWKTRYSKCEYDVLWSITFNTKDHKIVSMSVNWEES